MSRTERLSIRATTSERSLIARAASLCGMSTSAFIRGSASQEAELALIEAAWGMTLEETMEIFDQAERMSRR